MGESQGAEWAGTQASRKRGTVAACDLWGDQDAAPELSLVVETIPPALPWRSSRFVSPCSVSSCKWGTAVLLLPNLAQLGPAGPFPFTGRQEAKQPLQRGIGRRAGFARPARWPSRHTLRASSTRSDDERGRPQGGVVARDDINSHG